MKNILQNFPIYEEKINNFLLYLDTKLFIKRKYFLGLCRDIGHYLRLYPMLIRLGVIGTTTYWIWGDPNDDKAWEAIIAKLIVVGIIYLLLRWIITYRATDHLDDKHYYETTKKT